ncbi:DUF397 domain-containing protein [Nocardia carnea]|uniref:DUF397 domain-containing protein n=1 Tax=Nocardia carnea TaxID=37328 RepID=UPI0032B0027A
MSEVTNRVVGAWRKSTFSNPSGNCVEFAEAAGNLVAVRNSRFPDGGVLFGAVAKLGGEPRTLLSSSPGQHYGPACLDILEDPVDDHRVRVRLPVGKHRALPFPQ